MATSGTIGQTTIEVADIFDSAIRRCGLLPSALTPEVVKTLSTNLFMLLSNIKGLNLWRVQRPLYAIYPRQAEYTLATGTIDVLDAQWRTPTRLGGTVATSDGGTIANLTDGDTETVTTQVGVNGNFSWDFGSGSTATVNLIGILPATTTTYELILEWSDDGVTWDTVRDLGEIDFVNGVWQWFELDPSVDARFFRVREQGGAALSMREIYICQQYQDVTMYRMNRVEYSQLPDKRTTSEQALQYWLDRQLTPKMVLWPVPTNTFRLMKLNVHMHVEDVGAISNTLDIPQRWHEAIFTNLAFMSILDIPGADVKRYDALKDQADRTMTVAEAEERDSTPTQWTPGISVYTA